MASILVVDSSPLMRNSVADRLRKIGYTVHGASDPSEAMELLAGVHVDLLVLELQLQRGSGLELLRLLRRDANYRILPVIVYTHVDDAKLTRQATQLKVASVLYKDRSDFLELRRSIERLLARGGRKRGKEVGAGRDAAPGVKVARGHNGSANGQARGHKDGRTAAARRHIAR
jgi:CheY-like chemotaxis protein